ncbi:MAG: trypsin-like peptidase domain-containing protein [Fimbriimonadales bacterium]
MNPSRRSLKTTYFTLAAGAVLGAIAMATVLKTDVVPMAVAQQGGQVRQISNVKATDMDALRSLDQTFASLTEFIEPSVVHIRSESKTSKDLMGRAMPIGGEGSGVIYRPDGWILTNDHVVNGFDKVTVVLADGREFPGKVTRAEDSDLAVVKIDAKDLPSAGFADSSKVRPGQFAIAVGSPFGLENSVTIGHISALSRQSQVPDSRLDQQVRFYSDLIQTDASINMGNSGGPLLNVDGQVVGINTAIYSGTGGSVGIGFAIPSNQARLIADMLIEKGKITRGYLGLVPENLKPYQKKEMGIDGGAIVDQIPQDSPAAMGGLKKGDVILRVGDAPIKNQIDVRNSMLRYAPNTKVTVEVLRGTERKSFDVKIGTPPKNPVVQPDRPTSGGNGGGNPHNFNIPGMPDIQDLMPKGFGGTPDNGDVQPLREGKARLGVGVQALDNASRKTYNIPADVQGALVTAVEPGSVAEKLGLKPGDVVKQVGDTTIRSGEDLVKAMEDVQWGDTATLKWARYTKNGQFEQSRPVTFR